MTPIIVEGVMLLVAPVVNRGSEMKEKFDCYDCGLRLSSCVRISKDTGELFFEGNKSGTERYRGGLYCISEERDLVFVENTPEQIAKYVAARLEKA